MPPVAQRDRFEVVLVSPRNPLNIGAAARAMANFGFAHLSVAAPYEAHWREAKSAVGAPDVLQNARETRSLAEAVADCTFVLGAATVARRRPEQTVVSLPDLAPLVREELARGGRVALVFGSEKRGLTRDDLSRCHRLLTIPTEPRQPSINLGQAVAICLYELAARLGSPPAMPLATSAEIPASSATLERMAQVIEQVMDAAHYSPAGLRTANRHDLRLVLRRLALTARDGRRILGLLRRILYRLTH